MGTDNDAVANGTAPVYTVAGPSYQPASLQFGTTYYWKVNEVNAAATPSTWESDVWSFTTREYAVVDDFESYNDDDNRIYDTWIDGLSNNNGSLVGYMAAPFAEQTIRHGGKQSMPLEYNNVKTPYYSEAERTWDTGQNWTGNGADTLVLYFQGRAVSFLERSPAILSWAVAGRISSVRPISSASASNVSPATARLWPGSIASEIRTRGRRPVS